MVSHDLLINENIHNDKFSAKNENLSMESTNEVGTKRMLRLYILIQSV